MKITKQRLKEIIREELSTVRENDPHEPYDAPWDTEAEDSPFSEYDLEAENFKAELESRVAAEPERAGFWEKILDAVRRANVFEDPRRGIK